MSVLPKSIRDQFFLSYKKKQIDICISPDDSGFHYGALSGHLSSPSLVHNERFQAGGSNHRGFVGG